MRSAKTQLSNQTQSNKDGPNIEWRKWNLCDGFLNSKTKEKMMLYAAISRWW